MGGFRRGPGGMEEGRYTLAPVVKPPREGLSLESLDPGSRPLQSPKQRGGAFEQVSQPGKAAAASTETRQLLTHIKLSGLLT